MSTGDQQHNKLKETLVQVGLGEREVATILALLKIGEATASELSDYLPDIPRTSVYDQLKSLGNKGLISSVVKNGKTIFTPGRLEHLIDELESKKHQIGYQQDLIRRSIDTYEQIKKGTIYEPEVRFFRGKSGIMAVHRELQEAQMEVRAIGDLSAVARVFPEIRLEDNLKGLRTNNIMRWSLMVKCAEAQQYLHNAPTGNLHRAKWLPEKTTVNTDTLMWEGHVAIIDYNEPVSATVIDNPTIYQTFVDWFGIIWESSGKDI